MQAFFPRAAGPPGAEHGCCHDEQYQVDKKISGHDEA